MTGSLAVAEVPVGRWTLMFKQLKRGELETGGGKRGPTLRTSCGRRISVSLLPLREEDTHSAAAICRKTGS